MNNQNYGKELLYVTHKTTIRATKEQKQADLNWLKQHRGFMIDDELIEAFENMDKYIDSIRSVPTIVLEVDGKEVARCNDNVEAPRMVASWII